MEWFRHAAGTVPAYRAFLSEHGIDDPASVQTLEQIPPMTKESYVDRWPLVTRLAGGSFSGANVVSRSSGSGGRARTWPRASAEHAVGADLYEPLMVDELHADRRDVLCVVAFAMGTWIAGTYTAAALAALAERGLRICVATPGIVVEEIVDVLKDLAPQFGATLVLGYPPFVRTALTQARAAGVDLRALDVSCAYSGEGVTESFRDGIAALVGRPDEPTRLLGVYGAADIGLIGTETSACVALRRAMATDPELLAELAGGQVSLPALFVTDSRHRHVEAEAGKLLFTVGGAMPLVRYDLGDGGTIVDGRLARERTGLPLPDRLIALRGRDDVSAMFYGINLYVEQFKEALQPLVADGTLTGRFTASVGDGDDGEPRLRLVVERDGNGAAPSIRGVGECVLEHLLATSSEMRSLLAAIGKDAARPHVELVPSGRDEAFPQRRGKHQWITQ